MGIKLANGVKRCPVLDGTKQLTARVGEFFGVFGLDEQDGAGMIAPGGHSGYALPRVRIFFTWLGFRAFHDPQDRETAIVKVTGAATGADTGQKFADLMALIARGKVGEAFPYQKANLPFGSFNENLFPSFVVGTEGRDHGHAFGVKAHRAYCILGLHQKAVAHYIGPRNWGAFKTKDAGARGPVKYCGDYPSCLADVGVASNEVYA